MVLKIGYDPVKFQKAACDVIFITSFLWRHKHYVTENVPPK